MGDRHVNRILLAALFVVSLAGCPQEEKKLWPKLGGGEKKPFTLGELPDGPKPQVKLETSMGDIVVELYPSKAPKTVDNFLGYVDAKHYDGVIFHRVIPNFMIQTGGFEPGMREKGSRGPIQNESDNGLKNDRGTLAMARTPNPHSASDQFFINLKYNDFLDRENAQDRWGYCVFGKVVTGMDVVDKIAQVRTGKRGGHDDVPIEDVFIKTARRIDEPKKEEAKKEEIKKDDEKK
jgi:peptidyl-prolyl cis-trans isomerase B (cyclophilin B)